MEITFKQSQAEQIEIRKQLEQAMLPSVLDWDLESNINMLGAYLRARHIDPATGVFDVSFGNCWAAIKALKDALVWKVAPRKSSQSQVFQDPRSGKVIRDLRRERQERAEQEAREEKERAENTKSMADKQREAELRVQANKGIENLRFEVESFRGKSHSATAKAKAEMNTVIDNLIKGRRHLYDVMMAQDEIKKIGDKYWN